MGSYPRYQDHRWDDRRPVGMPLPRHSAARGTGGAYDVYSTTDSNDAIEMGSRFGEHRHAGKRVGFSAAPQAGHHEWSPAKSQWAAGEGADPLRLLREGLREGERGRREPAGAHPALSLSSLFYPSAPTSGRAAVASPRGPHAHPYPAPPPAHYPAAPAPGEGPAAAVCDMTYPLTDYFIATSHNTYLAGENQLAGAASEEAYAAAIRAGCRCVELDCWEGEGGPVVSHGHTLVKPVPFRRVLETIAAVAFEATPYPLVLDIENHCGREVREVMARHLREALGACLAPPLPPEAHRGPLPSPDQLRGRVLLMMDAPGSGSESSLDSMVMLWKQRGGQEEGAVGAEVVWNAAEGEAEALLSDAPSFFGIACSCSKPGPEGPAGPANSRLAEANKRSLTRVFPSGVRVDSRNYNPWSFWAGGTSLVALNWQSAGRGTELQAALFALNRPHGWLLKPLHLRAHAAPPPPHHFPALPFRPPPPLPSPLDGDPSSIGPERIWVEVTCVSARQLRRPRAAERGEASDLYLLVQMHTLDDGFRGRRPCIATQRTPTVWGNEAMPVWGTRMLFEATQPNYAVVRFVLMDEDKVTADDYVASTAVPLTALGPEPHEAAMDGKRYLKLALHENRAGFGERHPPVYEVTVAVRCLEDEGAAHALRHRH